MDVKIFLSELSRFIKRFGVGNGLYLFFRIRIVRRQNIKIPGIPYSFLLRKGTSDYYAFYQVIVHNQYNFNYKLIPEVIIDGGANIGLASIAFKSFFPKAMIIAIEPDKENFGQLVQNAKPYKNIFPVQAGLWNKNAILKVSDKYDGGKWAMVTEEVEQESPGTIKGITIGQIMLDYNLKNIDILKLDIETAERELFSSNYAEWLPKVKVIVIEFHDFMSKGTAMPFFKAINETFKNYSFSQMGENTIIINEDAVTEFS